MKGLPPRDSKHSAATQHSAGKPSRVPEVQIDEPEDDRAELLAIIGKLAARVDELEADLVDVRDRLDDDEAPKGPPEGVRWIQKGDTFYDAQGRPIDHRTDLATGIVDQRRARKEKCPKCRGQKFVPDTRGCGSGKTCPECEGAGYFETEGPAPVEPEPPPVPQKKWADHYWANIHLGDERAAEIAHAEMAKQNEETSEQATDADQDASASDEALIDSNPPGPVATGIKVKPRLPGGKPKRKRKRTTRKRKKADVPPWELIEITDDPPHKEETPQKPPRKPYPPHPDIPF